MKDIKLRLDAQELDEISNFIATQPRKLPAIPHTIDVTAVARYSKRIAEIGQGFNRNTAPVFIADFSIAYDITSSLYYDALKQDLKAANELDIAESIAYLENAGGYLESHGIKDTADARKRYVPLDEAVRVAADRKAETTALVAFLKSKLLEFKTAIESVKKLAYGDNFVSPDEGI
jgi:hypothetical protein